jgi:glutamate racemase
VVKSLLFFFLILTHLGFGQEVGVRGSITTEILNNSSGFYFIETEKYPAGVKTLPIGVFDSGIGGLTVLDAIVNFDGFRNFTLQPGPDGIIDFENEHFIYLADQANMPYGNYSAENKEDLLREHIIKDVQFLLGNKYYSVGGAANYETDKSSVKALVIACNTATAYGKETIEEFLKEAKLDIKVIGVIDAGVRGALEILQIDEDATIGVMATVGTVDSKGYVNTIHDLKKKMGYTGKIHVFQQGGIGIAEAVDEDADYYDKNLQAPRDNYKGPGLEGKTKIEKALIDIYNFDFDENKMLCDTENTGDCSTLQINDAENYVRYHLVSLMEQIKDADTDIPLKSIILGCTHYPYLISEINDVLKELYNYKESNGHYRYRKYMSSEIVLIDPAVNTARELYQYLNEASLLNESGDIKDSEFYISVANTENPKVIVNENGNFPYEYKYGRIAGEIQEYVKVVPFSRTNISEDILSRLKVQLPFTYELIGQFNKSSSKTDILQENEKIN